MLNPQKIKDDFPVFKNNPGLVYLDSASTSLKPQSVVDKLVEYYEQYPANIKRGIYKISERATTEYEETRNVVSEFINADRNEVIFTRNTTEAINLVAYSLGREIVGKGDEIITTVMEHHSNFVPWQQLAFENVADFKVIDITDDGLLVCHPELVSGSEMPKQVRHDSLDSIITRQTKILALTYVSNVLGAVNPVKEIAKSAHKINPNIIIVVDAAQAVPHMKVDIKDLGVDFIAFSGHKMLGPTGVGVLWGRRELLEKMFPFQFGGEMIEEVKIASTTFAKLPEKFEAGTPAIAEVIALKEAVKYLQKIGLDKIHKHELELKTYAINQLKGNFGTELTIYGPKERAGIISFNLKGVHPHDVAAILDENDICIRAGHHCTMPLHERLGIPASARLSFYLYNDKSDVDKLIESLKKVKKIFA